jgi:hypothetical protein
MAAFTYTQTDTILGKLTNGRKIVLSSIAIADAGTVQTITIKPLKQVIAWTVGLKKVGTLDIDTAAVANSMNTVTIDPNGDGTGMVVDIISVGE